MVRPTNCFIHADGTREWRDIFGKLHRLDGPAVIYPDGRKRWLRNGKYHRLDGPAIIHPDGTQLWYRNGYLHREDGPAAIRPDGTQEWRLNGLFHRLDGPAFIRPDGCEEWYRDGKLHRCDGPALIHFAGPQYWYLNDIEITKPILTKVSAKIISVFGPMVSESYQSFGGTRDGLMITFPTEEDCLLWFLKEK